MKKDILDLFVDFHLKFYADRKYQYKRYWVHTFIPRILNRDSAVKDTLVGEADFIPGKVCEFERFVSENEISEDQVLEYKDAMLSQKEEYGSRAGFIIVFSAFIAIFLKLFSLAFTLVANLEKYSELVFYGAMSIFLILMLLERDGIGRRVSASGQIEIVINRWLDRNSSDKDKA